MSRYLPAILLSSWYIFICQVAIYISSLYISLYILSTFHLPYIFLRVSHLFWYLFTFYFSIYFSMSTFYLSNCRFLSFYLSVSLSTCLRSIVLSLCLLSFSIFFSLNSYLSTFYCCHYLYPDLPSFSTYSSNRLLLWFLL